MEMKGTQKEKNGDGYRSRVRCMRLSSSWRGTMIEQQQVDLLHLLDVAAMSEADEPCCCWWRWDPWSGESS